MKIRKLKAEDKVSLVEHLEELRKRIIVIICSLIVSFFLGYYFKNLFISLLKKPLPEQYQELIFITPLEPFFMVIKVSFSIAVILSLPIIFYQIWSFVSPGLLNKEKKYLLPLTLFGPIFFLLGGAFAFFVLIPAGLKFLLNFGAKYGKASITLNNYLSFCTSLILATGVIFEIPLILGVLGKLKIISSAQLKKGRKYAIVIAFFLGAVLTPTPDVFNQSLLALPAILLYELSILIIKLMEKKK